MDMQQQQERLAAAVEAALAARNLTINAASTKLRIDRNALTRFKAGVPLSMELVERFARGLRLDVNEWRVLAGYEPIEDAAQLLDAGLYQISQRVGRIVTYHGAKPAEELTPDEARAFLAIAEAAAAGN